MLAKVFVSAIRFYDGRHAATAQEREEFGARITRAINDYARRDTSPAPRCSTQRAGILPPHAAGDELSGVTRDGALGGVSSGPASFPDGVPLTRAMIPWAMSEAST